MSEPREERHPSLYFPDGDIALSAKTAAGVTQIFRVDRIFLSRHSEIFRDMLTVSSDKSGGAETYDGVPLVVMPTDDTAEDVSCLLDVMYNIGALYRILSSPLRADTPMATAGLMKIAKKYIVKDIETSIVQHIASEWPTTLKEWDKRSLELQETRSSAQRSHPEPVSAIQFFHAHGEKEAAPYATYYQLCITPVNMTSPSSPSSPTTSSEMTARWALLNARDALILMQGKAAMASYAWKTINAILSKPSPPPRVPFGSKIPPRLPCTCAEDAFAKIRGTQLKSWLEDPAIDFLHELRLLGEKSTNGQLDVCPSCKTRITAGLETLRWYIWDMLPDFFLSAAEQRA